MNEAAGKNRIYVTEAQIVRGRCARWWCGDLSQRAVRSFVDVSLLPHILLVEAVGRRGGKIRARILIPLNGVTL
jgi:hypothetical protein